MLALYLAAYRKALKEGYSGAEIFALNEVMVQLGIDPSRN